MRFATDNIKDKEIGDEKVYFTKSDGKHFINDIIVINSLFMKFINDYIIEKVLKELLKKVHK